MTRYVAAVAALTATYALALASANPWDLGLGALLALGVVLAFRGFILPAGELSPRQVLRRSGRFPALVLATVLNIIRGTVQVARVVLASSPPRDADFIEIPQGSRTDVGVAISGLLDTLSPGSVLIDIDPMDQTWTLHVLDASDKEAVRTDINRFYDRYQRHVWP